LKSIPVEHFVIEHLNFCKWSRRLALKFGNYK